MRKPRRGPKKTKTQTFSTCHDRLPGVRELGFPSRSCSSQALRSAERVHESRLGRHDCSNFVVVVPFGLKVNDGSLSQSVSQPASRQVLVQPRRRVRAGVAPPTLTIGLLDCVCVLCGAASAVARTRPWRRTSSPCSSRAGPPSLERHVCR